jgi:ribosomal protein RSM22 (predicted rRNA methylase)
MNICVLVYLLRHVSANYYGHQQIQSQLHERKYIAVHVFLQNILLYKYCRTCIAVNILL